MEENKAPDKIYLNPLLMEDGESIVRRCTFERQRNCQIEYTRTDAFIEKAIEFFDEHLWEYIDVKKANCDTFINIDGDKLKEDFEEYLKK